VPPPPMVWIRKDAWQRCACFGVGDPARAADVPPAPAGTCRCHPSNNEKVTCCSNHSPSSDLLDLTGTQGACLDTIILVQRGEHNPATAAQHSQTIQAHIGAAGAAGHSICQPQHEPEKPCTHSVATLSSAVNAGTVAHTLVTEWLCTEWLCTTKLYHTFRSHQAGHISTARL